MATEERARFAGDRPHDIRRRARRVPEHLVPPVGVQIADDGAVVAPDRQRLERAGRAAVGEVVGRRARGVPTRGPRRDDRRTRRRRGSPRPAGRSPGSPRRTTSQCGPPPRPSDGPSSTRARASTPRRGRRSRSPRPRRGTSRTPDEARRHAVRPPNQIWPCVVPGAYQRMSSQPSPSRSATKLV